MKDEDGNELNGSHKLDFISEEEYIDIVDNRIDPNNDLLEDSDPNKFIAKMGAEASYVLLQNLDLDQLSYDLRDQASTEGSVQRKTEALKRLQVVEAFRNSRGENGDENRPEWMIMKILPVTPP